MTKQKLKTKSVKILYIVTVPVSWGFYAGQFSFLEEKGFQVGVCSAPGKGLDDIVVSENLSFSFPVDMSREISPWKDIVSLFRLIRTIRKFRPTVVIAGTPKAALLGMVAAFLARVPVRISHCHGLRLETTRGFKEKILRMTERITNLAATRTWFVSSSLKQKSIELGLASEEKTTVVLKGSANGIDVNRFCWTREKFQEAIRLARQWKIPTNAPVVGFIGRIVKDKGIIELSEAFQTVQKEFPETKLLVLGSEEAGDPVPEDVLAFLKEHPNVILTGHVSNPDAYLGLMDMLVLPTYREGFGVVVLEAAALGIPTIGTDATGIVDAVVNDDTGIIVPVGDSQKLAEAILVYLRNSELKRRHGLNAFRRVLRDFAPQNMRRAYYNEIVTELKRHTNCPPDLQLLDIPTVEDDYLNEKESGLKKQLADHDAAPIESRRSDRKSNLPAA